ncbi:MAG: ATP-binding protein, partial [Synergistaceae bacterium]|nr:ATP-binding protein [Synergistaceae bacterium]
MDGNTTKSQISEKFFNIAGPCVPEDHYMLDPLRRINYDEVSRLIRQKQYFVLHAPRQTGKTTSLLAMVRKINEEGRYHCVYMNVESAQTVRDNVEAGIRAILMELSEKIERFLGNAEPLKEFPTLLANAGAHKALSSFLNSFCQKTAQPLVLFIDEIDALTGDTLVSVLRQLRSGYESRPRAFPMSVVLCGVRDVRDYRIHISDGAIITGGSCFNIKAESLRLGDFSQDEIRELYEQHTAATGQIFEEDVYPIAWDLTHGQPWLVNALARQTTTKIPEGRDRNNPITLDIIEQAAEALILERVTHLDQLADKLREDRVRRVIAPMIAGEHWPSNGDEPQNDDIQYAIDLGLI